jgi:hypothetical protein
MAFAVKEKRPAFSSRAQFLAVVQLLGSFHSFHDLGECFRIGDGNITTACSFMPA